MSMVARSSFSLLFAAAAAAAAAVRTMEKKSQRTILNDVGVIIIGKNNYLSFMLLLDRETPQIDKPGLLCLANHVTFLLIVALKFVFLRSSRTLKLFMASIKI